MPATCTGARPPTSNQASRSAWRLRAPSSASRRRRTTAAGACPTSVGCSPRGRRQLAGSACNGGGSRGRSPRGPADLDDLLGGVVGVGALVVEELGAVT